MTIEQQGLERLRYILLQHILSASTNFPGSDLIPFYRRFMLALVALPLPRLLVWMTEENVLSHEVHPDIADATVTLFRALDEVYSHPPANDFETLQFRPAGPAHTAVERWYQPKHKPGLNPLIDNRVVDGGIDAALIRVLSDRSSQVGT